MLSIRSIHGIAVRLWIAEGPVALKTKRGVEWLLFPGPKQLLRF